MKNKNFLLTTLLFIIFSTISVFIGCEKNSEIAQPYELNGQQMLEKFNVGKLDHKKGEYLIGRVSIQRIEEGLLDFFLTTKDGRFVHYILQSEKSLTLPKEIGKAEVLFLRRSVVLNSLESKETILLTVDDESNLEETIKMIPFDLKLHGYGLARQQKSTSGAITSRALVNCGCCITGIASSACTTNANSDCDAGGSGATSCSLSSGGDSCSVECGTGTACCWD
ncbi:MAG: hypothetical protein K9J37_03010 [Saprospiraceae bacterium]|nr:hypothetical protein [Saprospiraceae bacterium]MCF8248851.1 hypothetical protein [Saprospiraceae bacterium]MCF8279576.1 hypothetical protein [Bacteroidales bacterium]MCF8310136.1 hypothetical protein [Saprospiraceae bacterium]MCF8439036.1 hypothetical protein [Saprospiraceae bacterium]